MNATQNFRTLTSIPDVNLVEPESSYQATYDYFHGEIVKALKADSFYALQYPTPQANCLDATDIIDEVFSHEDLTAMQLKLMITKNVFEVVNLRKEIMKQSIERLATKWASEEAASAESKAA
jgi:hypothetical protein